MAKKAIVACLLSVAAVSAFNAGGAGGAGGPAGANGTPAPVDLNKVYQVTFSDFARPAKKPCADAALKAKNCWVNPKDGVHYRYGCKVGDNKVLTDACGKNSCDEGCEDKWTWEGELSSVCYDDGSAYFSYVCHQPDATSAGIVQPMMPDVPTTPNNPTANPAEAESHLTCQELGWSTAGGSPDICGASKVDPAGKDMCAGKVDFWTAEVICKANGARLCTSAELSDDETLGTGCKLDCERVWSSSHCENGTGAHTQSGARKCIKEHPVSCEPHGNRAHVRCCAEAEHSRAATNVGPVDAKGYPSGFTPAVSFEYARSDGNCGLGPKLRESKCWVNPLTKKALRFACQDGETTIWAQNCADSSCASCSGEWFTDLERRGNCYEAAGVFYDYHCVV